MATGRPVILSAGAGGVGEYARDGENALVVAPGDPDALAAATARLAAEPDLRARLVAGGRATAGRLTEATWCAAVRDAPRGGGAVTRPAVTVIVPFRGPDAALAALGGALGRLALAPGDEILIADNRSERVPVHLPDRLRLIAAGGVPAPGYARNRAAAHAHGEWLVMLDADTVPAPDLIAAYFSPPPAPGTAVLAGGIDDAPQGAGAAAAHAAARAQMHEAATLTRAGRPYAQTANCAVRADAFRAAGGFDETARWGEDADLCFRLADAGWALEARPQARVRHLSRASLPGLLAQLSGHGAGAAWVHRRHPAEFAAPSVTELVRRGGAAAREALLAAGRRDGTAAGTAALELLEMIAFESGRLRSNRPRS